MIRMGSVWDRTVEVLQGRAGLLAGLAALYLFLPAVVSAALRLFTPASTAARALGSIVSLASGFLVIVAALAISAVASDPDVDAPRAHRIGFARLGPALAVAIVVMLIVVVVFVPSILLFAASGATVNVATERLDMTNASGAMIGWGSVAMLVAGVAMLWFSARLAALFPVVVNERRGVRAIGRSLRLTRGSALKLMGVTLLYFIVLLVVFAAVSSVVGLIARLLLGAEAGGSVSLIVAVAGNVVTAGATVVQTVFYTRFYVAARDRGNPAIAA